MLPFNICIIPPRLLRRHRMEMMKSRAARQWLRWHDRSHIAGGPFIKSRTNSTVTYYSAADLRRDIGRLAAMHCTHICGMCKYEKRMGIQKSAKRRRADTDTDIAMEFAQEREAERLADERAFHDEMDEIAEAFGHDMHRQLLCQAFPSRSL